MELGEQAGSIELARDCNNRQVVLKSISGTYSYSFNPVTREWKAASTTLVAGGGDNLYGLLTRDLLNVRKGVPAF